MKRVLVIRGGAIGDFILTLPALGALRSAYPQAQIEILGYKHIAALAEKRFYAEAVRSIEYGALSSFFAKNSELPNDLADYLARFDLVVSYLYDPDQIFENNLRRCGVDNLVCGPGKLDDSAHAVRQLLRPIDELGLSVDDLEPRLYPSANDLEFAERFLDRLAPPNIAIHPGSGSETKNWPIENWIELARSQSGEGRSLIFVAGEADELQHARLKAEFPDQNVRFAVKLPLPQLAAVLRNAIFLGHDSGISHLAAAAGAECILLFGPTNPEVWAPLNNRAKVLRAPGGDLRQLDLDPVRNEVAQALMRIGIST